jgi:hypothetical protein
MYTTPNNAERRESLPMPTPAETALLSRLAQKLDIAGHGQKVGLIKEAADAMGVTVQTVHRWLKGHRYLPRKRRADAGQYSASREECEAVLQIIRDGVRLNGKQVRKLSDAIDYARANGMIAGERIDPKTGEVIQLSASAITRAMNHYGLTLKAARAPKPHQPLASPHPNWCWQIDASVCVLFYLPGGKDGDGNAIVPLNKAVHYKNKPENLKAIEKFRVIRYVMTDHASGLIRVKYYPHSESGEHTVDFLTWLIAEKENPHDPMHGKPVHIMVDPGATAAGLVRRFCARLGINLIVNKPHNPRAKGQVEQAQNLWETKFEGWLNLAKTRVADFASLNELAYDWQLWFNDTKKHSRHKMTRHVAWRLIRAEELIKTAPAATLKQLATSNPVSVKVRSDLTIQFEGQKYRCQHVPGVEIGGSIEVCYAPLAGGGVMAIEINEDGTETHYPLEEVIAVGTYQNADHAAVVGVEYKSPPETEAVKMQKRLDMAATGAKTLTEAEQILAKDRHHDPFGGMFDPYIEAAEHKERMAGVLAMPVRFTPDATLPAVEVMPQIIPTVRAAGLLKKATEEAGMEWQAETFDWLMGKWSNGIPEDVLARLIANINNTEGGTRNVASA